MNQAKTLWIVAPLLLAGSPVSANDRVTGMMIEHGTCKSLLVVSRDASASCAGKLINTTWASGRSGFYFMEGSDTVVTFSGIGNNQIKPSPDVAIQPIDRVVFGTSNEVVKAVGSCRFTNPFNGVATVDCEAETDVGQFKGSFVSDGQEPKALHLK